MSKVTVIGAGNVGATCANVIAQRELASEIVLLDVKEGLSEGKALDMMQTATLLEFDTRIKGVTNNYNATAGSEVAVITSGIPRKPGMSREDLIGVNAGIVKDVTLNILKYSPNAIIVVVTNPLDTMTYLALKLSGLPKNQVLGMGNMLDSSRFRWYLSRTLKCTSTDVQAIVIGGHGDTTMIPLKRFANYRGIPFTQLLPPDVLNQVVADTMTGGSTITRLVGTSAWYAPGAAAATLVESIVRNQKKIFACSVSLDGEYGQTDICIGVPVIIGQNGWEKIVDYNLDSEEQAQFNKSADAIRSMNQVLIDMNML